ncbi:hypothetical protein TIFTF001_021726 [Ficus carica]|uniref:Uncharacterized protein n=1 Tax=Ficus carica TaxID=3494 RepID=A0AA88AZ10_FICCA|nr:hypothetical protein TIFTF001_021726 [Ficus carica]
MLHTVGAGGHRESNIFNSKTQNTETRRRKMINDRSITWERGRCTLNKGTVKQQMGEGWEHSQPSHCEAADGRGWEGAAGGRCTEHNKL